MTAVCAGGSSVPKAGVNAAVYVDQTYIRSLLPAALDFLYPYLPFMQGLAIGDVSAFCAADPPDFGELPSPADFLAFVTGGPIGNAVAVSNFLQALTKAYLWYSLCECSSGTPTPITPPTDPGDLPEINPPTIPPPSQGACLSSVSPRYEITDFNDFAVMLPAHELVHSADAKPYYYAPLPAGAQSFTATWDYGAFIDTTHRVNIVLSFWDAALAYHGAQTVSNRQTGSSGTFTGTIDPTWLYYSFSVSSPDTGPYPAGNEVGCSIDVYCGAAGPDTPAVPCCPPDPIAIGLFQQILNLLTIVQRQVTIVQRQAAPFAYVYGDNHVDLVGDGELAVFGLIGCSVDVTTLPANYGVAAGTPQTNFGLGFVTLGTDDGWARAWRIDHDGTLVIPPSAGLFTRIGYTLAPGVEVAIRELVREP